MGSPSAWILHIVTGTESLLLVPLLGALATRLYGTRARVPAMLLAACAPLFTMATEIRALGGYVETVVIGAALMLLIASIAERWQSKRSTLWLWALVGLLTGLSLWIDPLIVPFLGACVLWIAPVALLALRQSWKAGTAWIRSLALQIAVALSACWSADCPPASTPSKMRAPIINSFSPAQNPPRCVWMCSNIC